MAHRLDSDGTKEVVLCCEKMKTRSDTYFFTFGTHNTIAITVSPNQIIIISRKWHSASKPHQFHLMEGAGVM